MKPTGHDGERRGRSRIARRRLRGADASGVLEIGVDAQLEAFRRAVERSGIADADPGGGR
jgi:hypothetical protein